MKFTNSKKLQVRIDTLCKLVYAYANLYRLKYMSTKNLIAGGLMWFKIISSRMWV